MTSSTLHCSMNSLVFQSHNHHASVSDRPPCQRRKFLLRSRIFSPITSRCSMRYLSHTHRYRNIGKFDFVREDEFTDSAYLSNLRPVGLLSASVSSSYVVEVNVFRRKSSVEAVPCSQCGVGGGKMTVLLLGRRTCAHSSSEVPKH